MHLKTCVLLLCSGLLCVAFAEIEWKYDTSRRVTVNPSSCVSAAVVVDARVRGVGLSAEAVLDGRFRTHERSNATTVDGAKPGLYFVIR